MKEFAIRTLWRALISLVLLVGFVTMLVVIPIDLILTTLRALSNFVRDLYSEVVEDFLEIKQELLRVREAFVEAWRRGRP